MQRGASKGKPTRILVENDLYESHKVSVEVSANRIRRCTLMIFSRFTCARCRLRCSVRGVTRRWIFGHLLCVLPSFSFVCARVNYWVSALLKGASRPYYGTQAKREGGKLSPFGSIRLEPDEPILLVDMHLAVATEFRRHQFSTAQSEV